MSSFHVRVIEGGKIVIPAALRRKYGFEIGSTLVVDDTPGGMTIRSLDDAVAAAQAIMARVAPPERCLSDEIMTDRRSESERD